MNICLFSKDEIEKPLDKKDERAQHILKILHKKEGDFFYAGIIDGKAGNAQITEITDSLLSTLLFLKAMENLFFRSL